MMNIGLRSFIILLTYHTETKVRFIAFMLLGVTYNWAKAQSDDVSILPPAKAGGN